ncbi:MAG: hypothetical protein ACK5WS_02970 [Alphaproteobacteria bacterium]|nr:hypothetical protein [Candidatus Jidaibacter sp.]
MFTIKPAQNGVNELKVFQVRDSQIINTASVFCTSIVIASAFMLMPDLAEAATTAGTAAVKGEQGIAQGFNVIKGLVNGIVGKTIAIVSFLFGLTASVFKFNLPAIAGSFGVSLAATFGPGVIDSVVGATF